MIGAKRPSERLETLRDKTEILDFLVESGFDLDDSVRTQVGPVETTGVLLVGSVAEGYQNQASDVDILYLTYSPRQDLPPCPELFLEAGSSLESLIYRGGIEVNTEVIAFDAYASLAASFSRLVDGLSDGGQLDRVALYDEYALRLLHRLRTGMVLQGEDVVSRFRTDFRVDALPLYLSVHYLVDARESLEDARKSSRSTPGLVEYICRLIVETCLLALGAARGFTSPTRRHLLSWLEASVTGSDDADVMLRRMRDSLLNQRPLTPGEKSVAIAECERYYAHTEEVLRSDPLTSGVIDQVFAQISYADTDAVVSG
ncbi:hypothetical protein DMP17_44695 [Pseudonocardia sp. TMWB2A]|uniref:hypothetical protein n=1 Tax=Pseudonocardia sp. TMWB2A TaxID=687430 RepID=UPI00307F5128